MKRFAWLVPAVYIVFVLLPIYWLLNMSFKNTNEILGSFTLFPRNFTLENYRKIFTDPTWYGGYLNSLGYVLMNTVLSVSVALPAAYAFSRYRFLGDKHLFFWLLSNRMAPPAVYALPFFNLYSAIGLLHAVGGGAGALPVQCPAGGLDPRRLHLGRSTRDRRDRLPRRLFLPALLREDPDAPDRQRHRGRCLLLLHVLVGRAPAGADTDLGERQANCRDHDPHRVGGGHGLGSARGRRRADDRAGRRRHLVCPQLHRARLRARPGVRRRPWKTSPGWPGWPGRRRPAASSWRWASFCR